MNDITPKEAIANLNHIYGMVAPDIQRSLDVAIKALERPIGDLISREALKETIIEPLNVNDAGKNEWYEGYYTAKNEDVTIIDNAPTVPQVTVFTESTDEKAVADLKAELQSVIEPKPKGEWISVEDRLPDKNGNYLVLLNNGEMTTDIFDEEELFMGFWGYMTHWRPLPPKPYESEDNK